jgi:hypothetical protein
MSLASITSDKTSMEVEVRTVTLCDTIYVSTYATH